MEYVRFILFFSRLNSLSRNEKEARLENSEACFFYVCCAMEKTQRKVKMEMLSDSLCARLAFFHQKSLFEAFS